VDEDSGSTELAEVPPRRSLRSLKRVKVVGRNLCCGSWNVPIRPLNNSRGSIIRHDKTIANQFGNLPFAVQTLEPAVIADTCVVGQESCVSIKFSLRRHNECSLYRGDTVAVNVGTAFAGT
jgi:hypothetical protein